MKLDELYSAFDHALNQEFDVVPEPAKLYKPVKYIMHLGGKRIRPLMALAAYRMYKETLDPRVIGLAVGIEMFHNFTLIHDDIMDRAPLRRGKPTVHLKWNEATGILSGDLLQIQVYQKLTRLGSLELLEAFNRMAIELCEGQMKDMEFEDMGFVDNVQYLDMIRQKTAVLLGFSLQSGAKLAGSNAEDSQKLYDMGIHLGLAFQIMDDYLDVFGESAQVGKKIGGDILERKKTYMWNAMWSSLNTSQKNHLEQVLESDDEGQCIEEVKQLMLDTGASEEALKTAKSFSDKAHALLDHLKPPGDKNYLYEILSLLKARKA